MDIRSQFSQLLLFSEFPMVLPNFANHFVIHQVLVEHVDNQKRFLDYSYSLLFICSIPSSPLSFLDLEVIRAGWGTQVRHNCSVSQDRRGIDSLFVIPDHAAWENLPIIVFLCFLLDSSVFSILQFLGNFLHSFLHEDGLSITNLLHKCILSRWAWSVHRLASRNCRLWVSSSRRDSLNAYSEFLRFKFWISILYSVKKFSELIFFYQ